MLLVDQIINMFVAHGICRERFFQITLAELVHYLPRYKIIFYAAQYVTLPYIHIYIKRSVTTYCERRRLLNEIRLLVPSSKWTTPSTPTNVIRTYIIIDKNIILNSNIDFYQYKYSRL